MSFRANYVMAILAIAVLLSGLAVNTSFAQARKDMGAALAGGASAQDGSKKFEELLETKDLSNFRGYTTEEIPAGWSVRGKTLVFDGKGSGDIITKETYSDFELQVEWSVEKGGNSGIMFRVTLGNQYPFESGPEFQILDDSAASDGKNELTSAGSLYALYPAENKKLNGPGKWNKSRIIVEGNRFTHYLNGVKVVEAEAGSDDWNSRLANSKFKDWEHFNKATEGHLAFQNHGDPVKFRNIRVKRLNGDQSDADASAPPRAQRLTEERLPGRGR